jgi:orotidine-5'-phosphate decarboxylase
VTLSPLLGFDSIEPISLSARARSCSAAPPTPGGADLQELPRIGLQEGLPSGSPASPATWNSGGEIGLVVGATYPAEIARVREIAPTMPLCHPGIGAQGGDAAATVHAGWRGDDERTTGPIIVSSSRAVLYAGADAGYARAARGAAEAARAELAAALAQQAPQAPQAQHAPR